MGLTSWAAAAATAAVAAAAATAAAATAAAAAAVAKKRDRWRTLISGHILRPPLPRKQGTKLS